MYGKKTHVANKKKRLYMWIRAGAAVCNAMRYGVTHRDLIDIQSRRKQDMIHTHIYFASKQFVLLSPNEPKLVARPTIATVYCIVHETLYKSIESIGYFSIVNLK